MKHSTRWVASVVAVAGLLAYASASFTQTANKFVIGDRVVVSSGPLNVRATASPTGTLLGAQATGKEGTVIGGPVVSGPYTWWNINYDFAPDGWSAEDFLEFSGTPPVGGAPVIGQFFAAPSVIQRGSTTTLFWNIENARSLTISPAPGVVPTSSVSVVVMPLTSTNYTMSANNTVGTTRATSFVAVVNPSSTPPAIASFAATPETVTAGQSVTLSWNVVGANSISINQGIGDVTGTTSRVVTPAITTTYTLTAVNTRGNVSQQVTVYIDQTPPMITAFTANPTMINGGQSSTLSWNVVGADTVSINQGIGDVTGTTSRSVTPPQTTTYTLTADNTVGSVTTTTTVFVSSTGPVATSSDIAAPRVFTLRATALSESATITFNTSEPATTKIYYASTLMRPSKSIVGSATPAAAHSFDIQNLIPGKSYLYQIEAKDGFNNTLRSTLYTLRPRAYGALRLNSTLTTQVYRAQELLQQLGYYSGTPNGVFDTAMKTSVENFQRDKRIAYTLAQGLGTIGPVTWTALFEAIGRE